ncbi:two-partner secretion domain-containing protein [Burkholderia contaminans]|uniref:two-partner secretion domain-containing protein n=1 Tax=Burkholderia contaminans TaxID=488447 RepID=UPI00145414D5|nr:filamentous hemagglutinin N-terminal domain-containing protein [Burkholderia contaminans]VWD30824.1 Adhesin HecA family protein [Burkholderia contaminans]
MNTSKRKVLQQLAAAGAARIGARARSAADAPRFLAVAPVVHPYRWWQRATCAIVALAMFIGPITVTVEQGRGAAGVLGAGNRRMDDETWQRVLDLASLRVRLSMRIAAAAPIVDPTAPISFQPAITQSTGAGGGVPVVNITAPNAAGISLNQYQQFNIDPVGLILNNSLMSGTSLTGGNVQANANLNGRTASVIVNQVTSTGNAYASMLNGPLEVFGAPATVVIANPNGITTRGTGFTNTIGVTLSTGAPQFLGSVGGTATDFANAKAIGYNVTGGHLQIEGNAGVNGPGAGIEGTVGTIDLIGETIGINAPLYAGTRINAIAGRQFVAPTAADAYGTTYGTASNGAANSAAAINAANGGANRSLAIDATAFGAMTAGQIQVISTAAGMGVRADAQLAANAGDLTMSSNGDVSVAGSAAQRQATVQSSGNVSMTGAHLGVGGYAISASGDVTSTGVIQSGGKLAIAAGGNVNVANAQANGDVSIAGGPNVTLGDVQTGGALAVAAQGGTGGDVTLNGTALAVAGTSLRASRDIRVNGRLDSSTIDASAQRSIALAGPVNASGDLTLAARDGDLATTARVASGGNLSASAGHDVAASGALLANGDVSVRAGNSASVGDIHAGGAIDVSAQGGAGGGDLAFNGNTQATGATRIASARDIAVNGTLTGGSTLALDARRDVTVGAQGTVQSAGDLALTARTGSMTSNGTLTSASNLSVQGGQDVALLGTTGTAGDAAVSAGRDVTVGGTLSGRGGAWIDAGRDIVLGGSTGFVKDVQAQAGRNLSMTGSLAATNVTLGSGQSMTLHDVQSSAALQANAQNGALTIDGTVTSLSTTQLGSGGDTAVTGTLQSKSRLDVASGGNVAIAGQVNTLSTGTFRAGNRFSVDGTLQTTGSLDIANGGDASIAGTVNALSDAVLASSGGATVNGLLQSAGQLTLTSGANTSIGGTVLSTDDVTLTNAAGSLTSTGTIQAGRDLLIDAAHAVDLGKQQTIAQRDLTVRAGGDLTANGAVISQRNGMLNAGGAMGGAASIAFGQAAMLQSGGDTRLTGSLRGDTVQTQAGGSALLHDVQAVSSMSLAATQDLATTGSLIGNATTTLQAGRDLGVSGAVQSSQTLTLAAGRDVATTGALRTDQDLHVHAGNNAAIGDMQVGTALDVKSQGTAGGGDVTLNGNAIVAGVTNVQAARDIVVNGSLTGATQVALSAQRDIGVNGSGAVRAIGDLALTATTGSIASAGTLNGAGALTANAAQDVALTGTTVFAGDTAVTAGRDVTVGGTLAGRGGARVDAGRDIALGGSAGFLKDVQAQAGRNLSMTGSLAGTNVTLGSGQSMTLHDVQSSSALQANAQNGTLTVDGTVTSLSTAQLKSGSDTTVSGTLQSAGHLDLTSGGNLGIGGTVSALSDAAVTSSGAASVNGLLQSAGPLTLTSGANTSIGGAVLSTGDVTLKNAAGALTSTGTIQAGRDLLIDAAHAVDLGTQQTTAQRDLTVRAGGDLIANGTVIGQRNGVLNAGGALGGAAAIAFGQAATLQSGGDTRLTGSLRGDTVQMQAGGAASLHDVTAAATMSLTAAQDLATTGTVVAGSTAALQAGGNLGIGGVMQAVGDIALTATSGSVSTSGPIAGNGAIDMQAGTDILLNGTVGAARGMSLNAARDVSATQALNVLANDLRITAGNNAGVADVQAGGALSVTARNGDAAFNGTAAALGETTVTAGRDVVVRGTLAGGGDGTSATHAPTSVQAGRDVQVTGLLAGGATLGVNAARDVTIGNAGQVQAAGDMTLAAGAGSVTSQGTLAAERNVVLTAATDVSLTGKTSIGDDAALTAGHDLTLGGSVVGKGGATLSAGHDVAIGGSTVFANDVTAKADNDLAVTGALQGQAVSLSAARSIALKDVQSNAALTVNAKGGALTIDGTVNSLAGGTLNAAGDLTVNGALQAAGSLNAASGGNLAINGAVNALADATLHSAADLNVNGTLHAGGPLAASSNGTLSVGGTLDAATDATLSAARGLVVDGTVNAGRKLDMTSGGPTTLRGVVNAAAAGALRSDGDITVNGTLQAAGPLDVIGGGNTTVAGALVSSGDMTLRNAAGALTSTGTLQSGGNLSADAAGTIDLGQGRTTALGDLTANAGRDLRADGTMIAQGRGTLTAGGAIGGAGALAFGGAATLQSGGDMLLTGSLRGDRVDVNAGGNATLHDVNAGAAMTLASAGNLSTTGAVTGNADVLLRAGGDIDHSGVLQAIGNATFDARRGHVASTGSIATNGALAVKAATDIALGGKTASALNTALTAGRDIALGGSLTSGGAFDATAGGNAGIAGTVLAIGDTHVGAANDIDVTGKLEGHGAGTLGAGRDLTGAGTIAFAQAATLDAGRDVVQGGLVQGHTVAVTAAGNASVTNVQADDTLSLRANGTRTDTGPGNLTINGTAAAGGRIDAVAAQDVSVPGKLQGATSVGIDAGRNAVIGGAVQSGGAMTIAAHAGDLAATGGINSGATLDVTTGRDLLLGATTSAVGDMTLTAGRDLNTGSGLLIGDANGTLRAARDIVGAGKQSFLQGAFDAAAQRNATVDGLVQAKGVRVQGGNDASINDVVSATTLDLKALGNAGGGDAVVRGTAQAAGAASVTAAHDVRVTGALANGVAQTLSAGNDVVVSGTSQSAGDMKVAASGGNVQLNGMTTSGGALDVRAGVDTQLNGTIAAAGTTTVQAGRDIGIGGSLAGQAGGALTAARDITGAGSVAFGQAATLAASHDIALSGALQGASVSVTGGNNVGLAGVQAVSGDLSVVANGNAGGGDVTLGGAATALGAFSLQAARDVNVNHAINAGAATDIKAARNVALADVNTAGDLSVTASNGSAGAANVTARGNLNVTAGQAITLSGQTVSGGNATLASGGDMTLVGSIAAQQAGTLTAGGSIDAASIAFGKQATVSAANGIAVKGGVATDGDLAMTAGNDLTIGSAQAGGAIDLRAQGHNGAGDVVVNGGMTSGKATTIAAARDVVIAGSVGSGASLTAGAGRSLGIAGAIRSNADTSLSATNGNLVVGGDFVSVGNFGARAGGTLALLTGGLANGDTTLTSGGAMTLGGALFGLGGANLDAGGAITGGSALTFGKDIGVTSGAGVTLGAIQGAGKFTATSTGDLSLGATTAVGGVSATSQAGSVAVNGALQSGGNVQIQAANNAQVTGAVSSMGTVNVNGVNGNVTLAGVSSNGDTTLHAGQNLTLGGSSVVAGQLGVSGGNVTLNGTVTGSKNVTASAQGTVDAGNATIVASQNLQVNGANVTLGDATVGGALTAQASNQLTLAGGHAVNVVGNAALTSQNGLYNAAHVLAGSLNVSAPNLANAAGASLASIGATTINASNFTNAGLVNGTTTNVTVGGGLTNVGGSLMAVDALGVNAGSLNNQNGIIFAGNPSVGTGATGDVSLTVNGGNGAFYNAGGQLLAQRNMGINVANMTFDPLQGTISQGGNLSITAGYVNIGGTWNYGGQSVALTGLNGIANYGTMTGTAALTLSSGSGTFENHGQVSGRDVTFNGTLNNAAGAVMHADNALTLNGNTTNRGTVEAGSVLNVSGWDYDNQGATTQSRGDVVFRLGGTLQNTGGSINAGRNVSISAGAVVNDQTAPTGAVTTRSVVEDPNLLWSGTVGSESFQYYGPVANDSGSTFYGTLSGNRNVTFGDLLAPTGTVHGYDVGYFDDSPCPRDCTFNPSSPVAGSGYVTFNQVMTATRYGNSGNVSSQPMWYVGTGPQPGAVKSVSLKLPTIYQTSTSQQPGTSGVISAGGSIDLSANALSNRGGQIAAQGNVSLVVQNLSNGAVAPTVVNQSVRQVDQGEYSAFLSQLKSLGIVSVANSGNVNYNIAPAQFNISTGAAAPSSTGTLSSSTPTGMIAAGSNLTVGGGNLVNEGLLYAGNNVGIASGTLTNQGGNQQNYSSQVGCASGVPNAACGNAGQPRGNNPTTTTFSYAQNNATIYAGHDLVIAAGQINNTYGNLLAGHDIVIGGVGSTAGSTTPAQSLNNTSGNIVAGNDIKLNVSGAITNNLPPPVPVHENYGKQEKYSGCMTAGGYKESYCEGYVDQQSGSSSVISAGNNLQVSAGSLTNIGSLIAAGNNATISVAGPVVNEAQVLNAYWHSHWVQETGMFSSDKRHDIWACGTPEQCKTLYGSAYTGTGGTIDPPMPVGNIAATIQAPNLSISSGGQIQNVGNVLGTSVSLSGQKLINGITTPNTYTPQVGAPQRVITLSPVTLPGLNLSIPRAVGMGTLPTPVAGKASYVNESLGGSGLLGAQDLLNNLPPNLQPSSTLFYFNPQEENLLLQQAALQQTGKSSFVDGLSYDSKHNKSVTEQEKEYLYGNALDYSKSHGLQLGAALTQEQINTLDKPMLWYVEQTVPDPTCHATGTATCPTITALMPQVYLSPNTTAMSAGGNIAGTDVALKFNQDGNGSILNTGSIMASGTLSVDTHTLTNQANQVNVGEIWQKVDGGYLNTTGTVVQPGGFMSAANMELNVQALNQIGGALQKLAADGTIDQAGTRQALATLQQQLGSNFTQTTLSDNLHQDFVKEGGAFGMTQIFSMVVAVAAAVMMQPEITAAIASMSGAAEAAATAAFMAAQQGLTGVAITAAASAAGGTLAVGGLANTMIAVGLSSFASSALGQVVASGKIDFGASLKNGLIGAVTAGLTNGITFGGNSGSFGFSANAAFEGSAPSLSAWAGVQNTGNALVPQAGAAAGSLPAAMLAISANATIQAGAQTLIGGGSFLNSLRDSLVKDAAATAAFSIGNAKDVGYFGDGIAGQLGYVASHAALGCAVGVAGDQGCGGGAIGGAASAAFSPDFVKAIDSTGAPLDDGQKAALAAFATLVGGGLAGLSGQNAAAGAQAAQNEALNNTAGSDGHTANAVQGGGLASKSMNAVLDWVKWTYGDPGTTLANWGRQILGHMNRDYGGKPQPTDANNQLSGGGGDNMSGTAGAVVTPPLVLCPPGGPCAFTPPVPGAAGYKPNGAILSSGGDGGNDNTTGNNGFPKTEAVSVAGRRSIDKAQSYEDAIQGMYSNAEFGERQYTAIVNGKRVNGVADDVTTINGKLTAVEAKYVDSWSNSVRNPDGPNGAMPWALSEQQKMVDQARKYAAAFDGGVIYHTNSPELASYYSRVFHDADIANVKFVITPIK